MSYPVRRLVIPSARLISVASPKWKMGSRWSKHTSDGAAGAVRPLRRIICLKGHTDMTCRGHTCSELPSCNSGRHQQDTRTSSSSNVFTAVKDISGRNMPLTPQATSQTIAPQSSPAARPCTVRSTTPTYPAAYSMASVIGTVEL